MKTTDVIQALNTKSELLKSKGQKGTGDLYKDAASSLSRFKKSKIPFASVTKQFLEDYESWMLREGKAPRGKNQKKGSPASPSTIAIYLRNLRSVFNDAINDKIISREAYPFGSEGHKISTGSNRNIAQPINNIKTIMDFACEVPNCDRSRDFWVLSYISNGLNFRDLLHLKWGDINFQAGVMSIVREKSKRKKGSRIEIPLLPESVDIINKWSSKSKGANSFVFDVLRQSMSPDEKEKASDNFIKTTNRWMEKICDTIGIDRVTTYGARHSFATILLHSGAPVAYISKALGHSSMKTTESYFGRFETSKAKEYSKALIPS